MLEHEKKKKNFIKSHTFEGIGEIAYVLFNQNSVNDYVPMSNSYDLIFF